MNQTIFVQHYMEVVMNFKEAISNFWTKYGKILIITVFPVLLAGFASAFAVYQYYDSKPKLRVEIESIYFKSGNMNLEDRKVNVRSVPTIVTLDSQSDYRNQGDKALLPYLISVKALGEYIEVMEKKVKAIEKDEEEITGLISKVSNLIAEKTTTFKEASKIFDTDLGKKTLKYVGAQLFRDDFYRRRWVDFDAAVDFIQSRRYKFDPDKLKFDRTIDETLIENDKNVERIVSLYIRKYVKSDSIINAPAIKKMTKKEKEKEKEKEKKINLKDDYSNELIKAVNAYILKYADLIIKKKLDEFKNELENAKQICKNEKEDIERINKQKQRLLVNAVIMNLGQQGTAIRPYSLLRIQLNAESRIPIPLRIRGHDSSSNIPSSGVTKVIFESEERASAIQLMDKIDSAMKKDVESVILVQDIQGVTHLSKKVHISFETFKESILEELTVAAHKEGF